MSKNKKIILGIATLWPIVYIFLFIIATFGMIFIPTVNGESENFAIAFSIIFALHLLTMFLIFAFLIVYIRNVFKNNSVPSEKKALWAVVLFLGNMIAMPIYFYLYIWKDFDQKIETHDSVVK